MYIRALSSVEINPLQNKIVYMYNSVQWTTYTKDVQAILNSHLLIACMIKDRFVELARTISDNSSLVYILGTLIHPSYRRQSIGRQLILKCLENYQHVHTIILLTDNRKSQLHFYVSLGFSNTKDLQKTPRDAFVKMNGIQLK